MITLLRLYLKYFSEKKKKKKEKKNRFVHGHFTCNDIYSCPGVKVSSMIHIRCNVYNHMTYPKISYNLKFHKIS
jgi:hypothetical protein